MKIIAASSIALFLLAGTATAQTASWNNPAGGLWNVPGNWDTVAFPTGPTESALFNIGGMYTTTLNISATALGSVSILDPMCTLSSNTGIVLGLENGMVNNGTVVINNSNGGFATTLRFNLSDSLIGTGIVRLNGSGARSTLDVPIGQTLTHGSGHTILGIGRILGDYINNGTVLANDSGQTLLISGGTWTNNNLMQADNNGILNLTSVAITQGPAGELSILDGQITFGNTSVTGGAIRSMPGESWTLISSTNTFDSVNTIGNGSSNTGVILNLIDTIDNDGEITVNNSNGGFQSAIEFQNPFTLNGSGSILLNGQSTRSVIRTLDPAEQVTQASTHTIHGMGTITAPIINNGSIIADVSGQQLIMNTNDQVNNNLYQITNGATLAISNISIDQTGGGMIDADNGTFLVTNSTLLGGSIGSTSGMGSTLLSSSTMSVDQVVNNAPLSMNTGSTLAVTNGFENNSTLTINNTNGGFATQLVFNDSSTLSGSGDSVLNGIGSRARINTAAGETMTIDAAHTIRGFGQINASLINNGLINADVSGQSLVFQTEDKVNNATIAAQPGAIISVLNIAINQSPSAQINIGDGSMNLTSATINDGSINAGSGIVTQNSGVSNLNSVTLNAPFSLKTGTTINVTNNLINNDTMIVNDTNGGFATTLLFSDSTTLSGAGQVLLRGIGSRAILNTAPGQTMTIDSGFEVRGFGHINASLINNGSIDADTNGQDLVLQNEDKVNNSIISIVPGASVSVSNIQIDQTGGGQIFNNDGVLNLFGTTINGGVLDAVVSGVTIVSGQSTLIDMTNLSPINVNSGVQLNATGTITNHATIAINPTNGGFASTLNSAAPATITGFGEVVLGGTSARSQIIGAGLTIGVDQTLSGIGQINAPLTLDGTIAPGFSVGEIEASVPITLSNTGTYEVEVASEGLRDLIDSSSTFHADGTLDITLIDGFSPTTAWVTTIVTADAGVTGTFDTVIAPPPPTDPRLQFKVGYFDDEIRIGAVCDTDFNFSGDLDFFDVSRFLDLFNAQDPQADINNDGEFDFFDVSAFLSSFGMGCP